MLARYFYVLINIQKMRRCCLIQWLIFLCQVSWYFSYNQLWYRQFSFHLLSQIRICLLQFFTDYFVATRLFNPLFKGCGNTIKMLIVFNYFYENLFLGYFIPLVSYERHIVYNLIWTSSFPNLFNYLCCLSFNSFNYSCCFKDRLNMASNIWSYRSNVSYIFVSK